MGFKFKKIAIANRGEVAVRIIHACHELGISSVLLHSDQDVGTLAYRLSDEKICIGTGAASTSYLNIESNIQGALSSGADAIHPGFGFLSENFEFANSCIKNKIDFIGPKPDSIRLFGDKIKAKNLVIESGCPTVPGYQGEDQDIKTLVNEVEKIGFPCMVKCAGGGGGRGLKVIRSLSEAQDAIESAKREGLSSFGSDKVFLEKYLENAKHIEVQIFGDASGKIFHLKERDCSIQRKHQKIIEEAPGNSLDKDLNQKIIEAAVTIAQAAKYLGAGTVEFLVQDNEFYFMEMNTRLQVEHPVSEMILGVDLVKAQILTAMGQNLNWHENMEVKGHSIECRIYAEDPFKNGIPSTGKLGLVQFPYGPGRRFDFGFEEGDEVTPLYDSMIGKIIVWDESRIRTIQKMIYTLKNTVIFGINTNIPLLIEMLQHKEFVNGTFNTQFFSNYFSQPLVAYPKSSKLKKLEEKLNSSIQELNVNNLNTQSNQTSNPWEVNW